MKILLSAYACEPGRGSEEGFGWNWSTHLALEGHEVWVMTRVHARAQIEAALAENPVPNLHFIYVDIPNHYKRFIKGMFGVYAHYFWWQKEVLKKAQELLPREKFDLTHHVTWGSFVGGSLLWKIDTPFVFGPVGGGQVAPEAFMGYFKHRRRHESARTFFTKRLLPHFKRLRRMLRNTDLLLATNSDTYEQGQALGAPNTKLFLDTGLPAYYFTDVPKTGFNDGVMNILWVGRLLERKAIRLALQAVSRLDVPFRMTILGDGPQEDQVEGWIRSYGLDGKVQWLGRVPWDDVKKAYREHEVFLFTSIRDSFGSQLVEAMSNGLAIVALDHHGTHDFVPDQAGLKVPVTTVEATIDGLAAALRTLHGNDEALRAMSQTSLDYARTHEWSLKASHMTELYREVTGQTLPAPAAPVT